MAKDPIVFAMANPTPEIMPEIAAPYVRVMATGRSDYPNQINNVLAFPGIFKGALACRATQISEAMKVAAARGDRRLHRRRRAERGLHHPERVQPQGRPRGRGEGDRGGPGRGPRPPRAAGGRARGVSRRRGAPPPHHRLGRRAHRALPRQRRRRRAPVAGASPRSCSPPAAARAASLRRTALIYGRDGDAYVVVASKGGTPEAPRLVPQPLRRPGRDDPGPRRRDAGPRQHGRGRPPRGALVPDDRHLARLRQVPGQDRRGRSRSSSWSPPAPEGRRGRG